MPAKTTKIKIGGKNYPGDVWGIIEHRKLGRVFHEYAKSHAAGENTLFLHALARGRQNSRYIYGTFIDWECKYPITIVYGLRERADELAEKDDWDDIKWKNVIEDIKNDVILTLTVNFLGNDPKDDFWESDHFREFCFGEFVDPEELAKKHNIQKNKMQLADIMFRYLKDGDEKAAARAFEELVQKEGHLTVTKEDLMKSLP